MSSFLIDSFESPWVSSDQTHFESKLTDFFMREGNHAQKIIAYASGALDQHIDLDLSSGSPSGYDLSNYKEINFWIKSDRPGMWMIFSMGKNSPDEIYWVVSIQTPNAWELKRFYLGDLAKELLEDIKFFQFKCVNVHDAPATWETYLDGLRVVTLEMFADIEDALVTKLSPITVDGEAVNIKFKSPDRFVEEEKFPGISIWLYDAVEAQERSTNQRMVSDFNDVDPGSGAYRGQIQARVRPAPRPYDLLYQIDTWTRFADDDRELLSKFMYIMQDVGYLQAGGFPIFYSQVVIRTLDAVEGIADEDKLYRKSFTFRFETVLDPQEAKLAPVAYIPEFIVFPKKWGS